MEHFSLWVAAFLTLGIISFLYKDNPWYKLTEAIFVGISAGYWVVILFWDNFHAKFWLQSGFFFDYKFWLNTDLWFNTQFWSDHVDETMLLVGALLGFLMLLRLFPEIGWISRWSLAFIVGATSGFWMMNYLASNIMAQVQATMMPWFNADFREGFNSDIAAIIASLVVFIGTFTGLVYFFFSKEHKGVYAVGARIGVLFLMITFGAAFGYTVMSRMSLLIGRIDFLFGDWLGMIN